MHLNRIERIRDWLMERFWMEKRSQRENYNPELERRFTEFLQTQNSKKGNSPTTLEVSAAANRNQPHANSSRPTELGIESYLALPPGGIRRLGIAACVHQLSWFQSGIAPFCFSNSRKLSHNSFRSNQYDESICPSEVDMVQSKTVPPSDVRCV